MRAIRIKILSIIVTMVFVCGSIPANAFSDVADGNNKRAIETISALGLIKGDEEGNFNPEHSVNRAEFAVIIANICKIGQSSEAAEWYAEFFGSEENELELKNPPDNSTGTFKDLPFDHWAYEKIMSVVDFGMMSGTYKDRFEPDRAVYYAEGVKTIIKLLGYDVRAELAGGYPNGHISIAAELGVLSGISYQVNGEMTREDVARMIYNSLNVDLLQLKSYGETKKYEVIRGESLLTKVLELQKAKGQMTANQSTTLTTSDNVGRNNVQVDGQIFRLTKATSNAGEYIGRFVELYYKENKNSDINELVYITLSKDDESITISAENISGYSNNEILYFDDNSNRILRENIVPGSPMIYNGMALSAYDEDTFDIQYGNVTLVKKDGKYNQIILKDYTTMYVGAVDKDKFLVYNKSADSDASTNDENITLDTGNTKENIKIVSAQGEALDFGDISSGSVLTVAQNGINKEVIVTTNTVKMKVSELSIDGDSEAYIKEDNKIYKFSREYVKSGGRADAKVGDRVTLHLDAFGGVAWITLDEDGNMKTAFLIKHTAEGSLNTNYQFMLFDTKAKPFVVEAAKRVIVDDVNGISASYDVSRLETALKGYQGVMKYTLNSDGLIDKIELPIDEQTERSRLYKIFEITPKSNGNIVYKRSQMTFGGKIYINSSTIIVNMATDPQYEEGYTILTSNNFENDKFYAATAYTSIPNSSIAEVLVTQNISSDSFDPREPVALVTSVTTALTPNGEEAKKVVAFRDGKEIELYGEFDRINNAGQKCSPFDIATDPINESLEYSVVKGDMIRYFKNGSTGNVESVQVVYKADLPNPLGTGKGGYLAGVTDKYYILSSYIVDGKNTMYEENPTTVLTNGNPYALRGDTLVTHAHRFHIYDVRCMLGYVYSNKNGLIKVTTQDLQQTAYRPSGIPLVTDTVGEENQYIGVYVIDNYMLSRYKITYVEYTNNNVFARVGSANDVRSFEDSGVGCSKIIVFNRSGEAQEMIVINDLRD